MSTVFFCVFHTFRLGVVHFLSRMMFLAPRYHSIDSDSPGSTCFLVDLFCNAIGLISGCGFLSAHLFSHVFPVLRLLVLGGCRFLNAHTAFFCVSEVVVASDTCLVVDLST
ncbi:hypothetical protein AVEN_202592-1 [Araneus ventricosus]|uniref:Uncharacterized protein n=1 Tax=Araneus ventricosus TaxID=182803 RepID=A0A4Y2QMN3_ARAVE|nr:hypothetical protein AVEN_202592-1 [Araneus ventricosus]